MGIFDRLIATLSGSAGEAASEPAPAPAVEAEGQTRRFMGRDGGDDHQPTQVAERGFDSPAEVWLHVQPATQRLVLVEDLGVGAGEELTPKMMQDLQRKGLCDVVAYHAGYEEYWKMPSQEAILRTPSLHGIETPLPHKVKVDTRLVKPDEMRGFWMHVRIRGEKELPAELEAHHSHRP